MANHNLDAEQYIVECSRQWAESVVTRETSDIERFVADDFVGINPEGNSYNKAELISHTRTAPRKYASNHLNEVKIRFFGDAAVAQGSETFERHTGENRRGRVVWTDTWVRRGGRWQIVAAQDVVLTHRQGVGDVGSL